MRPVDDAIDVAVTVIFTALLIFIGVWCWNTMHALYATDVTEKTAITQRTDDLQPEYVYTGQDVLLSCIVNDNFCPSPKKMVFQYKTTSASVEYNAAFFEDKESAVNKLWTTFFKDAVKANHAVFKLQYDGSGKPTYWLCTLTD